MIKYIIFALPAFAATSFGAVKDCGRTREKLSCVVLDNYDGDTFSRIFNVHPLLGKKSELGLMESIRRNSRKK